MGCGASARRYAAPLLGGSAPEGDGAKGSSASPRGSEDESATASSPVQRGRWLWEESPDVWQAYDPRVNDKLNAACEVGECRLAFVHQGNLYEVNFSTCIQTHWDSGNTCKVRYKGPTPPKVAQGGTFEAGSVSEEPRTTKDRRPAAGEWQFEGPPGTWTAIDGDAAKLLRRAKELGKSRVIYEAQGNVYGADLDALVQMNLHTGFKRRIRWMPQKQFQWQLKNGVWVDYDDEENEVLAAAIAEGKGSVSYSARGFDYMVNLESMEQENVSTNSTTIRPVRVLGADVFAATIEGRRKRAASEEHPKEAPPTEAWAEGRRGARPASRSPSPPAEAWTDDKPRTSKRSARADDAFRAFVDGGGAEPRRDSKRPHKEAPSGKRDGADPSQPREKRWSFERASRAGGAQSASPPPAQGAQPRRPGPGDHAGGIPPRPGPTPSPRPTRDGPRDAPPREVPPPRIPEAKKLKLPRGVDWPEEPAARAAAKALFAELSSLRDSGASAAERRKAYRHTCLRWHPDKNPEDEDTATDVFQFLQDIKDWCIADDS